MDYIELLKQVGIAGVLVFALIWLLKQLFISYKNLVEEYTNMLKDISTRFEEVSTQLTKYSEQADLMLASMHELNTAFVQVKSDIVYMKQLLENVKTRR
ncbi:MAG: hypothetical protein J7L51_01305 [Desulfurococcales archaeon]|nr:hypothetical protein [Desulfurococcales archaeon]